jgi:hypothetical protein
MNQKDLIQEFNRNRLHLILAQLAPTGLLAFASFATPTIAGYDQYTKAAFALILLASGILGALAEFSAAASAQAVIDDLRELKSKSALAKKIIGYRPWLEVAKYVTPAIFVAIFAAIMGALYR